MKEAFEKIKERLEERLRFYENRFNEMSGTDRDVEDWGSIKSYKDAIEIVNQVAEEYGKGANVTTDGFIFTREDVQKIIDCKKRRLDDLEHCWNEFTRHMECGEIRELKESCIDDEIMIHILSEWLLKDVPDIYVGENEEFCEWKPGKVNDVWCPSCEPNSTYTVSGVAWFRKCPYCGKKIKVVE